MANVFEKTHDPLTGLTKTMAVEDGKFIIHTAQDLTPHLESNKALRDDPDYTKQGIKNNFMPAVHIPDVVCHEIKVKHGFDVYRASALELRLFLRKHRDEYSYLFVTGARI